MSVKIQNGHFLPTKNAKKNLGRLWQGKQPTNFLIGLSLLSLKVTKTLEKWKKRVLHFTLQFSNHH